MGAVYLIFTPMVPVVYEIVSVCFLLVWNLVIVFWLALESDSVPWSKNVLRRHWSISINAMGPFLDGVFIWNLVKKAISRILFVQFRLVQICNWSCELVSKVLVARNSSLRWGGRLNVLITSKGHLGIHVSIVFPWLEILALNIIETFLFVERVSQTTFAFDPIHHCTQIRQGMHTIRIFY